MTRARDSTHVDTVGENCGWVVLTSGLPGKRDRDNDPIHDGPRLPRPVKIVTVLSGGVPDPRTGGRTGRTHAPNRGRAAHTRARWSRSRRGGRPGRTRDQLRRPGCGGAFDTRGASDPGDGGDAGDVGVPRASHRDQDVRPGAAPARARGAAGRPVHQGPAGGARRGDHLGARRGRPRRPPGPGGRRGRPRRAGDLRRGRDPEHHRRPRRPALLPARLDARLLRAGAA